MTCSLLALFVLLLLCVVSGQYRYSMLLCVRCLSNKQQSFLHH
jgi:hypothetical protein